MRFHFYLKLLIISSIILFFSCQKNQDGTVATVIPFPPTNLKAAAKSSSVIELSWSDNSTNEDVFKIERKTVGGNFTLVGTTISDVSTYKDSLLTPNTTYTYRVYSYNSAGKSITYTNLDSAKTMVFPENGLVAYYPFTGNAFDSSGNGNNGTVVGAKSSSDRFGNANSAYIFDGISNFIDLGNIKGLNTNQGLSIAIWINWSGLNGISNDQYAFSMGPNPNASLTFDNNNTLTGNVLNCNCASDIRTTTNITPNNWFFVTLTYDLQSGTQKLYINGKLVSTSIENMFSYYQTNSGSTTIGKYWYNLSYFKGSIDDIKIYNRVLIESEITYLATH